MYCSEFCARVWVGQRWFVGGLDNVSGLFVWLLYLPILFFVLWFVIFMLLFWTENMMLMKLIHGTESWPFYGQQNKKKITYVQKKEDGCFFNARSIWKDTLWNSSPPGENGNLSMILSISVSDVLLQTFHWIHVSEWQSLSYCILKAAASVDFPLQKCFTSEILILEPDWCTAAQLSESKLLYRYLSSLRLLVLQSHPMSER